MKWPRVDLRRGPDLAELAEIHDGNAIADVADDREIVGDEQEGEAVAVLHVLEQVEDLGLHGDVERRDRFIAHDHVGVEHEAAGDRDPLALPAGELMGPTSDRRLRVETDGVEHLGHTSLAFFGGALLPHVERISNDPPHALAGVER